MEYNSIHLSKHLKNVLRLIPDNIEPMEHSRNGLSDGEIIEHALQHDLPVFISIDGSLDDNGIATVSISVVAPDIRESDSALE
jgi:hypothetical protein